MKPFQVSIGMVILVDMKSLLPLLFLSLVTLFSCSNEDLIPPDIVVEEPMASETYGYGDTVFIKCQVSDNNVVKTLGVDIVNQDQQQVASGLTIPVNSANRSFNEILLINDRYLESGAYSLRFTASDGVNTRRKFISLHISGLAKIRKDIFITSVLNGNTEVYRMETSGSIEHFKSFTGKAIDGHVSSYHQDYYCLTEEGILYSTGIVDVYNVWQVEGLNNVLYTYTGKLFEYNKLVYTSSGVNKIFGYNNLGALQKTATLSGDGFYPGAFILTDQYYFVNSLGRSTQPMRFEKIAKSSGVSLSYRENGVRLVDIFELDGNHIIAFGNSNGIASGWSFDIEQAVFDDFSGFPQDQLHSSVQVSDDIFILAIGSSLYKFNNYSHSIVLLCSGIEVTCMAYDELSGNVACAVAGNQFLFVDAVSGTISSASVIPGEIVDVSILYNK